MKYAVKKTTAHYNRKADRYDTGYHSGQPNYYRFELVKKIVMGLPMGHILDAGCGTGRLLAYLLGNGFTGVGVDIADGMLTMCRKTLAHIDDSLYSLENTALDDLDMFPDSSFDHVFCLSVFPYIPEDQERECYRELRRVLKTGGMLITSHQNELFDLFTFNKFTLRFFERNIFPLIGEMDATVDTMPLKHHLASLISNPEAPCRTYSELSSHDRIFTRPENPVTFPEKLLQNGFRSNDTWFYHFHALPPLLMERLPAMAGISRKMEGLFSRRWQAALMASTFVNVARAV